MATALTYSNVQAWMMITCPASGTYEIPNQSEAGQIATATENDFIADTGLAVNTGNAKHMKLCSWICEKKYQVWARNRHFAAESSGNPAGNASYPKYSFTKDQYDDLIDQIVKGETIDASMAMVDAETNPDGFTNI